MTRRKTVGRRHFLRVLVASAGVATTVYGPLAENAAADGVGDKEKRKARYQADSSEVQDFYRVNRYPSK